MGPNSKLGAASPSRSGFSVFICSSTIYDSWQAARVTEHYTDIYDEVDADDMEDIVQSRGIESYTIRVTILRVFVKSAEREEKEDEDEDYGNEDTYSV